MSDEIVIGNVTELRAENDRLRAQIETAKEALRDISGPTAMAMDARDRVEVYRDTARAALKELENTDD